MSTGDADFSLTSPSTKQSQVRQRSGEQLRKRKPSKAQNSDPRHSAKRARVIETYFAGFERARGVKPAFEAREGKAVNDLLTKLAGDEERACGAVRNAYADPFWRAKATIRTIADDPSKFLGTISVKTNGRTPTQPNYGVSVNAEIVDG